MKNLVFLSISLGLFFGCKKESDSSGLDAGKRASESQGNSVSAGAKQFELPSTWKSLPIEKLWECYTSTNLFSQYSTLADLNWMANRSNGGFALSLPEYGGLVIIEKDGKSSLIAGKDLLAAPVLFVSQVFNVKMTQLKKIAVQGVGTLVIHQNDSGKRFEVKKFDSLYLKEKYNGGMGADQAPQYFENSEPKIVNMIDPSAVSITPTDFPKAAFLDIFESSHPAHLERDRVAHYLKEEIPEACSGAVEKKNI